MKWKRRKVFNQPNPFRSINYRFMLQHISCYKSYDYSHNVRVKFSPATLTLSSAGSLNLHNFCSVFSRSVRNSSLQTFLHLARAAQPAWKCYKCNAAFQVLSVFLKTCCCQHLEDIISCRGWRFARKFLFVFSSKKVEIRDQLHIKRSPRASSVIAWGLRRLRV